ncbi:MAG: Nif3-like dinuclear metal center hexameric protein [Peptostreptococcaceae bacterium]|nr:Nif3-like dinuclear metal center hexameric protein [Peptostreptococcaceae bacterium]
MKRKDLLDLLQRKFPEEYAEDWDNTGFIIDVGKNEYERILVALELTPEVLSEALGLGVDIVITHHPIIFKSIKKLSTQTVEDSMIIECIKHDISVFTIHTNCDNYEGGTNDYLSKLIGLRETEALLPLEKTYIKLVVFAPSGYVQAIRNRMGEMGGGGIGLYSHCTFAVKGTGSFKPLVGSNPFVGEIGKLETVEEMRLETILPLSKLESMVKAIKEVHPYEEMAYDIIPLANLQKKAGNGRVGRLDNPMSLKILLKNLKSILSAEALRYTGDENRIIDKVGLCTGSGSDLIREAYRKGVDCFLTGDIKYHDAQFARMNNMVLVDIGHYESENIFKYAFREMLVEEIGIIMQKSDILVSEEDINPFKFFK